MKKISRRHFNRLSSAVAVSSLASQGNSRAASKGTGPNVIFFMTDDQRSDSLGCAGHPVLKTPNIDRIASEGARFTNAFVTNSLCGPSRATCLTGMYSHNTGVKVNEKTFPSDETTIFERARKGGYRTAFVGKWHNKPWGRDREFDYYFGFRGQGQYHDPLIQENDGPERKYEGWVEDVLTDKTLKFIEKSAEEKQPFLLCHWMKTPHQHCLPAERHKDLFSDVSFPKPPTFETDYEGKPKAVKEADLKIVALLSADTHKSAFGILHSAKTQGARTKLQEACRRHLHPT
ncbi:MAG: sulfatase-like hydrolase/transferase, partial [bacterium]